MIRQKVKQGIWIFLGIFSAATFSLLLATVALKSLGMRPASQSQWLDFIKHLDVMHYLLLAEKGYSAEHYNSNAFFPLLPQLIALVQRLTSVTIDIASMMTSFLGLLLLFISTSAWALFASRPVSSQPNLSVTSSCYSCYQRGWVTGLGLFLHPAALFLFIPYNESFFISFLLIFLLIWEWKPLTLPLLCLQRILIFILSFLMASCRPNGLFIAPAAIFLLGAEVLIKCYSSYQTKIKSHNISLSSQRCHKDLFFLDLTYKTLLSIMGSLCFIIWFVIHLKSRVGDGLAFWYARHYWNETPGLIHLFDFIFGGWNGLNLIKRIMIIMGFFGVYLHWKSDKKMSAVCCLSFIVLPLYQGKFGDMLQHMLLAFPVFSATFFYLYKKPMIGTCVTLLLAVGSVLGWILWARRDWLG